MDLTKLVQYFMNEAHTCDSYSYRKYCNQKLLYIYNLILEEDRMKEKTALLRLLEQAECNKCRETVIQIREQLKKLSGSKTRAARFYRWVSSR